MLQHHRSRSVTVVGKFAFSTFLTLRWYVWYKSYFMEKRDAFVCQSQYQGFWRSDDVIGQDTNRPRIGLVFQALSRFQHQWPLLLIWFNFNPSMDK